MVLTLKFRQAQFIAFDLCTLTFDFIFSGLSRLGFHSIRKLLRAKRMQYQGFLKEVWQQLSFCEHTKSHVR
jgi:hypothetical protein